MTIELTPEELEILLYHLEYDIETIRNNHQWEEIGRDKEKTLSLLEKLKTIK
jgi:hypothetical protein